MASPKYHDIKRFNKGELNALKGEVEKSRIAVENITKLGAAEGKYKSQVTSLQTELQACVASINMESKKYKMLSELISILKGEMFNYQKTRKQEEELEQSKKDKLINKSQYEIDQILQKHNQEIAKIHNLKDLANSGRSERVVYSSLFKKLEKEIKHFEEIYKEQLITFRHLKNNYPPMKKTFLACTEVEQQKQKSLQSETHTKQNRCALQKPISENEEQSIINHKEELYRPKQENYQNRKKIYLTTEDKDDRIEKREAHYRQEKLSHTKAILNKISEYNSLIEKLKIHSESSTSEEILSHFSEIEDTNKELLDKIYECDAEIEEVTKQTKALQMKINDEVSKMVSQETDIEIIGSDSILKSQLMQFKSTQKQEEQAQLVQQVKEVADVCCLHQFEDLAGNELSVELCRQLDEIIVMISKQIKASSKGSRKETGNSEAAVEGLLDKMEKFHSCQKILDRELLQQEYYRELGKKKSKQKKESTR